MWDKYKSFAEDSDYKQQLVGLRKKLEEQGLLDSITDVIVDERDITLVSGAFSLGIMSDGDLDFVLKGVSNTFFPEQIIDEIPFPCFSETFVSRATKFIKHYGINATKWDKKTKTELYGILKQGVEYDSPELLHLFVLDAIQELVKRDDIPKIEELTGWGTFKCAFTGLRYLTYSQKNVKVYTDDKLEVVQVFNKLPGTYQVPHLIFYNGNYFSNKTSFVLVYDSMTRMKTLRPGSFLPAALATGEQIVPECIFKATWAKVSCGHYTEEDVQEGLCVACMKLVSPTGKIINGYSTRAPDILLFQKGNENQGKFSGERVYFGAEIELENGGTKEAIALYKHLKDYMLVKSDGSVTKGFEIVTTPCTYEVHKKRTEQLFEILGETKMLAAPNCGLHFHVSRKALSSLQIGKQLEFLYNPANKQFVENIAGRGNSTYAKMTSQRKITDMAPENYHAGDRYEAINLNNKDTIEFRIFASTTKYDVFMHRLDFVKALIDYTKPCMVNVKSLSELKELKVFEGFLKGNLKEYPFLCKFLNYIKPSFFQGSK